MSVTRISLWSGPRNISTALMYSFRRRPDTTVVDEPLYAHYLRRSGVVHPGRDDVLADQDSDGENVVRDVILAEVPTPVLFVKNMGHHLRGLDWSFLSQLHNVILTRDPAEMLPSLIRQLPDPDLEGTGLPVQVELLDATLADDRQPLVVDSRLLLTDPRSVLTKLLEAVGLDFHEAMLSWPPGPVPEDGIWAPHWYDSVHSSTGFAEYRAKQESVPRHIEPLLAQAAPLYERLLAYAIRP